MKLSIAIATAALLAAGASFAQPSSDLTDGEVKKVDRAATKLTIQHGPLPLLDMPPMTMVFKVQDPKMLDEVKAGSKVRFRAERVNGVIVITKIEKAE